MIEVIGFTILVMVAQFTLLILSFIEDKSYAVEIIGLGLIHYIIINGGMFW